MPVKRSSKATPAALTPLEAQKRALAEKQARNEAEIARQKKLIEEAPRRAAEQRKRQEQTAEEQRKRQQEEFIKRVSRSEARFGTRGPTLRDPRFPHELNIADVAKGKSLRIHRNQGMYTFFILCFILAGVLCWLYYTVIRPT